MSPTAKRNLILWLLGGAIVVAIAWRFFDGPVDSALSVAGHPSPQRLAWWCSEIGEGWFIAVWGISFAALFLLMRRPGIAAKIFFVGFTAEMTGLAATICRTFIGRTRPSANVPQGIYGIWHDGHWIIGKYEFGSFPSGHSAVAAGLLTAVWLFSPRWRVVAVVYAVAVMWSRIAQSAHHLSDVMASIVLSVPIAVLMNKYFTAANEIFFQKLSQKMGTDKPAG
ncbi:MAG TPA: phosphatase PAP2 family protein [Verrucomicrobiae bacterium]|nr:phosphatase PAP2 family protein [Verrucomicrobiae bacterium]